MSNETSAPMMLEDLALLARRLDAMERLPGAWTRGMIILWYGVISDIPTGWWPCDGTVAPDGVTTPDMRGRFPVGLKTGDAAFDTLGETGGAATANLQHAHVSPQHRHAYGHSHLVSMGGATGVDGGAGGVTDVPATPNDVTVALDIHEHVATADTITVDTALNPSGDNTDNALSTTQNILPPYTVAGHYIYRYV